MLQSLEKNAALLGEELEKSGYKPKEKRHQKKKKQQHSDALNPDAAAVAAAKEETKTVTKDAEKTKESGQEVIENLFPKSKEKTSGQEAIENLFPKSKEKTSGQEAIEGVLGSNTADDSAESRRKLLEATLRAKTADLMKEALQAAESKDKEASGGENFETSMGAALRSLDDAVDSVDEAKAAAKRKGRKSGPPESEL